MASSEFVPGWWVRGPYLRAMAENPLIASLLSALDNSPQDVPLRVHLATLLADAGRTEEALRHCGRALADAPGDAGALGLMRRLTSPNPNPNPDSDPETNPAAASPGGFDWSRREDEVADIPVPAPVTETPDPVADVERPTVRLADVGGMEQVKERLELTLFGPMRNPGLARQYGRTGRGGLLLYGPPGCGKTFLARAVAGELGARFIEVGIAEVMDMWVGRSERNLAELFDAARRNAPCVLFLDEVDALGQKRTHLSNSSSMRNTVNQLLTELDGDRNDGVFVLGATNHPWDLDSALRRPGRFDRMLLVLPPDPPARAAILRYHLRERPAEGVDVDALVRVTERFSGADLAHLCDTAAERALAASMRDSRLHPIGTDLLLAAAREIQPSTEAWFATARNVALFANTDGSFDELAAYLRKQRKL